MKIEIGDLLIRKVNGLTGGINSINLKSGDVAYVLKPEPFEGSNNMLVSIPNRNFQGYIAIIIEFGNFWKIKKHG